MSLKLIFDAFLAIFDAYSSNLLSLYFQLIYKSGLVFITLAVVLLRIDANNGTSLTV
jgi:hypothetical protein